jgi:hypothetical protein
MAALKAEMAATKGVGWRCWEGGARGRSDAAVMTRRAAASTRSLCWAKKSTPRMGLATAARMKLQEKWQPPKHNFSTHRPQDIIALSSGPDKKLSAADGGPQCGKTLTAAPVSTKNVRPLKLPHRKMSMPTAVNWQIRRRPARFPAKHRAAGT